MHVNRQHDDFPRLCGVLVSGLVVHVRRGYHRPDVVHQCRTYIFLLHDDLDQAPHLVLNGSHDTGDYWIGFLAPGREAVDEPTE